MRGRVIVTSSAHQGSRVGETSTKHLPNLVVSTSPKVGETFWSRWARISNLHELSLVIPLIPHADSIFDERRYETETGNVREVVTSGTNDLKWEKISWQFMNDYVSMIFNFKERTVNPLVPKFPLSIVYYLRRGWLSMSFPKARFISTVADPANPTLTTSQFVTLSTNISSLRHKSQAWFHSSLPPISPFFPRVPSRSLHNYPLLHAHPDNCQFPIGSGERKEGKTTPPLLSYYCRFVDPIHWLCFATIWYKVDTYIVGDIFGLSEESTLGSGRSELIHYWRTITCNHNGIGTVKTIKIVDWNDKRSEKCQRIL